MFTLRPIALALLTLPMFAACAGVLGIDPAELEKSPSEGTGGKGGSSGAGSAGTTSNVDAGLSKTLCTEYCNTVQKNCTAPTEVYISMEACLGACKTLPTGTPEDTSGNTVGCRLHYATSAGTLGEKAANCSAAGPGGNSVCGTNCDGFCSIVQATCAGIYPTDRACNIGCLVLPDKQAYDDSIQAGDSVQCRLYHATAATVDSAFHCPHTDITRAGPCGAARK